MQFCLVSIRYCLPLSVAKRDAKCCRLFLVLAKCRPFLVNHQPLNLPSTVAFPSKLRPWPLLPTAKSVKNRLWRLLPAFSTHALIPPLSARCVQAFFFFLNFVYLFLIFRSPASFSSDLSLITAESYTNRGAFFCFVVFAVARKHSPKGTVTGCAVRACGF